jgi:molecular chaperone IbpA
LAVAGFDEEDFNIQLHDGVLTVSANVDGDEDETEYLHKGIAARSFVRKFTLADTIEIVSASLHQGMLTISLKNVIPEEKRPLQIPINKELKTSPAFLTE